MLHKPIIKTLARHLNRCGYFFNIDFTYHSTILGIPVYVSDVYLESISYRDKYFKSGRLIGVSALFKTPHEISVIGSNVIIVTRSDIVDEDSQWYVILHEIGHLRLNHFRRRIPVRIKELEADIFAMMRGVDVVSLINNRKLVRRDKYFVNILQYVKDYYPHIRSIAHIPRITLLAYNNACKA